MIKETILEVGLDLDPLRFSEPGCLRLSPAQAVNLQLRLQAKQIET